MLFLALLGFSIGFDVPLSLLFFVSLLLGFLLSTLLPAMHEAVHGNLSVSRTVNNVMGNILGAVLLISFPLYRRTHLAHHAHLGRSSDAEIPTSIKSRVDYVMHLSPWYFLVPFWSQTARSLSGSLGNEAFTTTVRFVTPMLIVICVITFFFPIHALFLYWGPLWFSAAFMFLTTVHEHYGSDESSVVTRSISCGPILSWFLWNSQLHEEHHAHPGIPFDQLRQHSNRKNRQWQTFLQFHKSMLESLPLLNPRKGHR